MAKNVNIEEIRVKVEGITKLGKLSSTFTKLNKNVGLNKTELNKAIKSITSYDRRGQRSVNTFNQQIAALKQLKDNVGIGSAAYKKLGGEIDSLRAKMEALLNTQQKSSMMMKLGAGFKAGGSTALLGAVGRYLPAGAQIGGIAGYAKGGMAGAISGAGIGLGIDATVAGFNYVKDAAIYSAEIEKLEIALKGVVKNQKDYNKALKIISDNSKRLNVPIAASTKQFTQLAASVLGAGGTIEQAQVVFEGVSNSIKATGGNAEDVQSAIRAMSQIFGKGKVSAEELQGQLGERLAGAVVKFAEANGSSLQQLQKDLRDGVVGLDQVIKFAEQLNVDFRDTAIQIAKSGADAGQRLRTLQDLLKRDIGKAAQPIGAAFQKSFGEMTLAILESEGAMMAINGTIRILGSTIFTVIEGVRFLTRVLVDLYKIQWNIMKLDFKEAFRIADLGLKETGEQFMENMKRFAEIYNFDPFNLIDDDETFGKKEKSKGLAGLGEDGGPLATFAKNAFDTAKQAEQAFVNAFKGMEDALVKFVQTGKLNFSDLARSIIADLTRMLVRAAVVKPLFSFLFPGLADGGVIKKGSIVDPTYGTGMPSNPQGFSGYSRNAKGNVFAQNKIVPYAMGGIVSRPTIFPMANGMGLMGEAGPEAIMPLKRGANGKLGVQSSGGIGNIVVNVDASGSSVEGDAEQSEEFGQALAAAIQSEIIQQQRPGGLLS